MERGDTCAELMESNSNEDALARRRTQKRLAPRRFRWKKSQEQQEQQQQQQQQRPPRLSRTPKQTQVDNTFHTLADPSSNDLVRRQDDALPQSERELGDVRSPGGLQSNLLSSATIRSPSAESPITTCRFRLLGNEALLASTSWMYKVKPSSTGRPTDVASRPAGLGSSTDVLPDPTRAPGLLHRPPHEVEHRASGEAAGSAGKGGSWQGPLHTAAQKGHEQMIRLLLPHTTDCDERDGDGITPLFYAIKGAFEGIATALLDSGARIDLADDQQRNALHLVVVDRRAGMLGLLLERSDGDEGLIESYDAAGMTPLHVAVDIGFEAGVQLLLQYGANPDYRARKK